MRAAGTAALVEERGFCRDLYYRVNVIRLVMPPLRERPSDIPLLAETILRRLSITRGMIVDSISRDAMRRLMRHDFPGNVRELENILEHAYVLSSGRDIEVEDLPDWLSAEDGADESGEPSTLEELEGRFIRDVLARNSWNRTAAQGLRVGFADGLRPSRSIVASAWLMASSFE